MSSVVWESLIGMVKEFEAQLSKGDNKGAWTCVLMDDVPEEERKAVARQVADKIVAKLKRAGAVAAEPP